MKVVQVVNTMVSAVASSDTTIPCANDDTIPAITEGYEYMTLAITPKSATNKLKIEVVFNCSKAGTERYAAIALFQDTTSAALAAIGFITHVSGEVHTFTHYMTAGTTSATTFRIRAGCNEAETLTFNGASGGSGRGFGGVMASSITITEYEG